jgi:hypothetical protein
MHTSIWTINNQDDTVVEENIAIYLLWSNWCRSTGRLLGRQTRAYSNISNFGKTLIVLAHTIRSINSSEVKVSMTTYILHIDMLMIDRPWYVFTVTISPYNDQPQPEP